MFLSMRKDYFFILYLELWKSTIFMVEIDFKKEKDRVLMCAN